MKTSVKLGLCCVVSVSAVASMGWRSALLRRPTVKRVQEVKRLKLRLKRAPTRVTSRLASSSQRSSLWILDPWILDPWTLDP